MMFETAQALSLDLAILGISHTVEVGRHDKLAPEAGTAYPRIHARVDLGFPRGYDGGLSGRIKQLKALAAEHGLILATSMMGEGLTFTTEPTTGILATGWPGQG